MTLDEDSLKLDQVRRNFSRHAAEYEMYARVQRSVAAKLVTRLSGLGASRQTLEIGCGTGILSRYFVDQYPEANLWLSDIAHGMSRHVSEEFPSLPVIDADASALPFSSGRFDQVISSSVYQWVDHLPRAFSELRRVLRPGGQACLALFGERTLFELRESHAAALHNGVSHGQGFPDCPQIEAALDGLFEIELLESSEELEWHATVPDLLRSLKAIGAQNASRDRPAGFASRRVMQQMYVHYQERYGGEQGIPATYEVIYLRARKLSEK